MTYSLNQIPWYPTQRAIAAATSCSRDREMAPSLVVKRSKETDFTWKASAPTSFVMPFVSVGAMCTNQGQRANEGFHSVRGTMIRNGSLPTEVGFTTSARRSFWISAPLDGSKLTSQISPLRGLTAWLIMGIVEFFITEGIKVC